MWSFFSPSQGGAGNKSGPTADAIELGSDGTQRGGSAGDSTDLRRLGVKPEVKVCTFIIAK